MVQGSSARIFPPSARIFPPSARNFPHPPASSPIRPHFPPIRPQLPPSARIFPHPPASSPIRPHLPHPPSLPPIRTHFPPSARILPHPPSSPPIRPHLPHPPSFSPIRPHFPTSALISPHPPSFPPIRPHFPPSARIFPHPPASSPIRLHLPPSACIFPHPPASSPIRLHLPPSACIFPHPPASSPIRLHLPPSARIFPHPPASPTHPPASFPHPPSFPPIHPHLSPICLCSPPAYYFRPGYGLGANKWLIYLMSLVPPPQSVLPTGRHRAGIHQCSLTPEPSPTSSHYFTPLPTPPHSSAGRSLVPLPQSVPCRLRANTDLGSTNGWHKSGSSPTDSHTFLFLPTPCHTCPLFCRAGAGASPPIDSMGAGFQGMLSSDSSENPLFYSWNTVAIDSMGAGFQGMLSGDSSENPLFYSWNTVVVLYCDGAIFYVLCALLPLPTPCYVLCFPTPSRFPSIPSFPSSKFEQDLNNKGMQRADSVLLTGCSAGAIAVSMACDAMAQFHFPRTAKVKCLMDAGFFMDTPDISNQYSLRGIVQRMFRFHSMTAAADDDCRTVLISSVISLLSLSPFSFILRFSSLLPSRSLVFHLLFHVPRALTFTFPIAIPPSTAYWRSKELWRCFFPQYNLQYAMLKCTSPLPAWGRRGEEGAPMSYAEVRISPARMGQTWRGWGTSLGWFANYIGKLPPHQLTFLLDLLFHPSIGLGLNLARYLIGGSFNPLLSPQFLTEACEAMAIPGYRVTASAPSSSCCVSAVDFGARSDAKMHSGRRAIFYWLPAVRDVR
ncbi:unnamed protein product [Closterium sp. Naga37s-1]|nr:unnamed protein product [Closterium sp. Naga37s-1]